MASHPRRVLRPVFAGQSHPLRADLERQVERRFQCAFDARVTQHHPLLVGLFDDAGKAVAAAGLRFAADGPLFLETYLDDPAEEVLSAAFGRPVARAGVVEIGSLVSDSAAAALRLFDVLQGWLDAEGLEFAMATIRPELMQLLIRSGHDLRPLAAADPARLGPSASHWGSYYDSAPQVFAGEIASRGAAPRSLS